MEKTKLQYRDEIAMAVCDLLNFIKGRKEVHYDILPGAYAPKPYIEIITKDIDYIDGTRIKQFESIVKENITQCLITWGVEYYPHVIETKSGTRVYASGLKIKFHFYPKEEEKAK